MGNGNGNGSKLTVDFWLAWVSSGEYDKVQQSCDYSRNETYIECKCTIS